MMDTTTGDGSTGDAGALPAPVADWVVESDRQREELRALIDAYSTEELMWRRGPGKWAIADHVSHLVLTNSAYIPAIAEAARRAKDAELLGTPPYRSSFVGSRFLRMLEPPVVRRFKTMKRLEPSTDDTPPAARVEAFEAGMEHLERVLRGAADVDLGRAKMRSPLMWLMKLTLAEAVQVVLAHNRRHLWLADEVIRSPGFPAAGAA
ncbi:MAG: DinB family protein [Gemmatimonadota bacterium]